MHVDSDALTRNTNERAAWSAVRQLLLAIGEDPNREGLADTPKRVYKAFQELTAGLQEDPKKHLLTTFELEDGESLVLSKDIPFTSLCEHHLMLFTGVAHIGYIPSQKRVVGLSKLARVVEGYAKRPQIQERLTNQIASAIWEGLEPRGVAVLINSQHTCQACRGVKKLGSMTTFKTLGELDSLEARAEFLALLKV